ncbi:MAG: cyclic nucleotide-binding domain-containing protein [Mariprofundaceae bacterium]|nr:cyclic nucleotide-binding domain-containing protein [Mariprofundaceae bacterium]
MMVERMDCSVEKEVLLEALMSSMTSNVYFETFRNIPLIKEMTEEHAILLFSCMKEKRFEAGEVVYHAGTPAEGEMYLILDGKVGVEDESGHRYGDLRVGGVFGLFTFLDDKRNHSATVQAEKDTVVLSLERNYFDLIALEEPKLGQQLMYFMFRLLSEKALKVEVEYAHMHQFALGRKV